MQHSFRQAIDEPVKPILTGPFSQRTDCLSRAIAKAIVPLPASVSLPLPKRSPHQPEFFLSRKCPFIGFRCTLFSPQPPHGYSPISVMSTIHFPRDDPAKDPTTPRTKPPAIPPTAVPFLVGQGKSSGIRAFESSLVNIITCSVAGCTNAIETGTNSITTLIYTAKAGYGAGWLRG